MFVSLQARLLGALAVIGAVLIAIARIFYAGKKSGQDEVKNEINKQSATLNDKFNEIAAGRPDLDASLGRLRARSGDQDTVPPASKPAGAGRGRTGKRGKG